MPTPKINIPEINVERLTKWEAHLNSYNASAVLLLGVGHDHTSGQLVVCVPEMDAMDNANLVILLQGAIKQLQQ